ncbi:MAG TPA: hypothetical protein VFC47_13870 [Caulobacteraceae bacterium]|nr:hypothetical protein [Caulobacteraceae bacterium]
MNSLAFVRNAGLAAILAGALAAPAMAQDRPDASIHFHGGSVAFIAGIHWGSGHVNFHGRRREIRVNGLSVGAIGATSYDADGEVFNLHRLSDIEGTYGAAEASATAGAGAGEIDMKNDKGVEIRAHSTSAGLKLSLGGGGVQIELKH